MLKQSLWNHALHFGFALMLAGGINAVVFAQSQGQSDSSSGAQSSNQVEAPNEDEAKETKDKPKKVKIGGIEWYVDYDVAMEIANREKKPMWLHFGENPG